MLFYTILAALLVAATAYPGSLCKDCECKKAVGGKLNLYQCKAQLELTSKTFAYDKRQDSIHVVSIDGAFIHSISADAFNQFSSLQDVVIKNSKIGSIDPKAFDYVSRVSFVNCAFEDEPVLVSDHMEELKFVNCQLTAVPKLQMGKLLTLNLTNNTIKSLDLLDFANLKEIEEIDMSNNELETIPSDIFVNNDELNTITFDNNPLREFIINTTNNLEYISLKGCKLRSFDSRATKYLDDVSDLYLNNNEIDAIYGLDMAHMGELQIFDISNNKLKVLDPDVFENNTNLEKIYLDGNKLQFLPVFVSRFDQFKTFLFSCNNCGLRGTISPLVFKSMSALYELHLSGNDLTNVDDSFSKISSLQILDLSNNRIQAIGASAFIKNPRLETLYISGNKLTTLNPEAFSFLRNLVFIEADNNEITKLWTSERNITVTSLKTLYVKNNKLRSISTDDLDVTPKLTNLGVTGNELDCDQNLISMIGWLAEKGVAPPEITHMSVMSMNSMVLLGNPEEGSLWRKLALERCPNMPEALDLLDNEINKKFDDELEKLEEDDDSLAEDKEEEEPKETPKTADDEYDYYYEQDDPEDATLDPEQEAEMKPILANIDEVESVRYASYILSLTTVFVLTALFVLFIAVTVILLILKKNGSINMQTANIPRFKIRSWSQATGIKKHSGSIYRPLSEDLLPQTPQLKRYEFASSPTVHSAHP